MTSTELYESADYLESRGLHWEARRLRRMGDRALLEELERSARIAKAFKDGVLKVVMVKQENDNGY